MNAPAETVDDLAVRVQQLEHQLAALRGALNGSTPDESLALVCFSGEWDKLFAAFTIANGALAMGQEVHMFFTFWGASAIRDGGPLAPNGQKNWVQRMLGAMLPNSANTAPLSRMNFMGLSKRMLRKLLKAKGADDLPVLIEQARDMGAKFYCCDTSLQLFGWNNDDLLEGEDSNWCGVSTFLNQAMKSKATLFI